MPPWHGYIAHLFNWLFVCYPLVSQVVFSIFMCRTVDGTPYVEADYTLTCDTPAYRAAQGWSIVWAITYVFGFPLGLLYALRAQKPWVAFVEADFRASERRDGKRVRWRNSYWRVCDFAKRFFLSSALLFFRRGRATRIALALLIPSDRVHPLCCTHVDVVPRTNSEIGAT